jgi:DNA invertase Pin-like site-specific DNA recombinase
MSRKGQPGKDWAYRRVSSPTQRDKGYGLDTQKDAIEKYCEQNGITIDGWFSDEGITGVTDDITLDIHRPGVQDLLSALSPNDRIIVLNTSRIWRNDTSKVLIRHEVAKVHADIISIEQPSYSIYFKDPSDFLVNSILEILDEYDKLLVVRKLANGRRTKARQGTKGCGSVTLGYKWTDKAEIEIDEPNMLIVTDIFRSYIELRSLSGVAEYCKSRGYTTLKGNDFSKQSIKNILTNDFYVGIVTHAGQKFKGNQPVFISIEVFNEVQKIMGREPIEL